MNDFTTLATAKMVERTNGAIGPDVGLEGGKPVHMPDDTTPASTAFSEPETKVCYRLGIRDRAVMRQLRHELLKPDEDWVVVKKRFMLTPFAAKKIADHILREMAQERPSPLPTANPPSKTSGGAIPRETQGFLDDSPPILLWVVRSNLQNRRVLFACHPTDDPRDRSSWLTVRVRDNSNFLPGTATGKILARRLDSKLYEFAGHPDSTSTKPRCPRWRGKW